MPDQHDSAPRPRPFVPTAPPFRGPATAARPALAPLTPDAARPPAPFVARRAARPATPAAASPVAPVSVPAAAPAAAPAPVLAAPPLSVPAAPAIAADDQHLYGNDPFAAPAPSPTAARRPAGDDAAPDEAALALAGLPYFDAVGSAHAAKEAPEPARTSGKVRRLELGPAAVLESLAARVRAGTLVLGGVDDDASDPAVLAAVLVALLRDQSR